MNKKLSKDLLRFILEVNNDRGATYNQIYYDLDNKFRKSFGCTVAEIQNNLRWLHDNYKIEGDLSCNFQSTPIRITALGLHEFDRWFLKAWRFFKDDMAKVLSVIATILAIIAFINSFGWI